MAKQNKYNIIMTGASGNLADQVVFRQKNGQTVLAKVPFITTKKATAAQQAVKDKFKAAALYAKTIMLNADVWKLYVAKTALGQSAYQLAIADYFSVPVMQSIVTSYYQGVPGDKITVLMGVDELLRQVRVTISAADGTLIERGTASLTEIPGNYEYKVKNDNLSLPGTVIQVDAWDYAENTVSNQVTIN
ncbi:MAG: hypothetical protein QM731_28135 [Chitinophagaceae bacterium]